MVITSTTPLDQVPGEPFLISCLQKFVNFSINNKIIKKGKLLLFRRTHYFIQVILLSEKGVKETLEIPFPFNVENYTEENLMYFDYRLISLETQKIPKIPPKVLSIYFDKILEIQAF